MAPGTRLNGGEPASAAAAAAPAGAAPSGDHPDSQQAAVAADAPAARAGAAAGGAAAAESEPTAGATSVDAAVAPGAGGSGGSGSDGVTDASAALAWVLGKMGLEGPSFEQGAEQEGPPRLLSSPDIAGIADLIKAGKAKNIICMCGAGISVSAGIPDFRTPGTGLFSQLKKYRVSTPEQLFHIDFFKREPEPFHVLARELFPGRYRPTPTHTFMKLLHDKGLLLRCYTQNIDSLETVAGLPKEATVAAHGNFDGAHCIACSRSHPTSHFKAAVDADELCRCVDCGALVKPDIVFYGEDLPPRFFRLLRKDFPKCDLLIVLGTSLVVYPFAGLIHQVGPEVPRLLINRELVGDFDPKGRDGDALFLGDCDAAVAALAALLGWEQDFKHAVAANAVGPGVASEMGEGGGEAGVVKAATVAAAVADADGVDAAAGRL